MPSYTVSQLQAIAQARSRLHRRGGRPDPRVQQERAGRDLDFLGVLGEAAFASRYDYPLDEGQRKDGDHGIDFWTVLGPVDVKTAPMRPCHLLQPAAKVGEAHIYVLAYGEPDVPTATLLGWCFKATFKDAPIDDGARFAHGTPTRYLHQAALRPMAALDRLMQTWERINANDPAAMRTWWEYSEWPSWALPTARRPAAPAEGSVAPGEGRAARV